MSAWPSRKDRPAVWRRAADAASGLYPPLVLFLAVTLFVRLLTDDRSAPDSRHSGSLNLSSVIALLFILAAAALLFQRRRGLLPTALAVLWLCLGMAIAVNTSGASTETLREGVRELSVVALFVVVYNARGAVTVPTAARLVQVVGLIPAVLAVYQLATQTGMNVHGNIRAHGTFAHPNSAAMFFAIAAVASLWLYLDDGRRRVQALLFALFAVALIATFSIDGLLTLTAMLVVLGALRPGSLRAKLGPCALAGVIVLAFFATPLGSKRVAGETATSLSAAERGETTSTLDTRLYRWKTLLPEWEESPILGRGLGTTTTSERTAANRLNALLPHNEYIRYLVETGIVGMAILLFAVALLIRDLSRRYRATVKHRGDAANASLLGFAVVAGCLVNSLADNTLLNSPTCYAAALILAAVLGAPAAQARGVPAAQPV